MRRARERNASRPRKTVGDLVHVPLFAGPWVVTSFASVTKKATLTRRDPVGEHFRNALVRAILKRLGVRT